MYYLIQQFLIEACSNISRCKPEGEKKLEIDFSQNDYTHWVTRLILNSVEPPRIVYYGKQEDTAEGRKCCSSYHNKAWDTENQHHSLQHRQNKVIQTSTMQEKHYLDQTLSRNGPPLFPLWSISPLVQKTFSTPLTPFSINFVPIFQPNSKSLQVFWKRNVSLPQENLENAPTTLRRTKSS